MAVAATRAPKVISWVDRVDDLSWLPVEGEEGWVSFDAVPDATLACCAKSVNLRSVHGRQRAGFGFGCR